MHIRNDEKNNFDNSTSETIYEKNKTYKYAKKKEITKIKNIGMF